jgi:hypothetical protein
MKEPTLKEIWEEELGDPVWTFSDPGYRHGEYRTEVFKRESDDTFWEICYCISGDGEQHELREHAQGWCGVGPTQVRPREIITVEYVKA